MRIQPTNVPSALAPGPPQLLLEELRASAPPRKVEYFNEVVVLSPLARNILWYTVLLLIISNASVLAVFALVYAQNEQYDSLLWLLRIYFLFSDSNAFLRRHSAGIAAGYGVLSGVFYLIALRMVYKAVSRRQYRIGNRLLRLSKTTRRFSVTRSRTRSAMKRSIAYLPVRLKRAIMRARAAIGVRGPYFEMRLLIEEWFELGTQTIAAHSASQSISNPQLNITYAAMIFANSISTVLYPRLFPTSLVKQRLACVLTDLVLDFLWSTILPVWMYVPIIQVFLARSTLIENLTSFSGFTRQVERILVISWKAYALSLIPFVSTLLKLLDLQRILRELIPRPRQSTDGRTEMRAQLHIGRRRQGLAPRIVHLVMPVYGVCVLLTSLAANEVFRDTHKQTNIACNFRVHPWFSTEEACLQRQLSCATLGIAGDNNSLTPMLDLFDSSSLSEIYFVDCPALDVPSGIHQFERLSVIVIVNCTVVSWDASAGLSDVLAPDLRTVLIFDVEFLNDPVGFTGLDGPVASSLEWIHLQNVNANRVFPLVGGHWRSLLTMSCVNCNLTEFPAIMYELPRLETFSLAVNNITFIPDDWLQRRPLRLQMVWLGDNPQLTELPDALWRQTATCSGFFLQRTNLSVVPEWVADIAFPGLQILATDSPVCTGQAPLSPRLQTRIGCVGG